MAPLPILFPLLSATPRLTESSRIHNGDTITASYVDASGTNRTATAAVNLVPPAVTAVTATIDLGVITITWQTSEAANSVVHYSTNQSFNLSVTNSDLVTSHIVRLYNLVPGQTYYFIVGSTDLAGNSTINNNGGSNYSFIGIQTPTVLLVDAYETADGSAPVIPDSSYTNALNATGFNAMRSGKSPTAVRRNSPICNPSKPSFGASPTTRSTMTEPTTRFRRSNSS